MIRIISVFLLFTLYCNFLPAQTPGQSGKPGNQQGAPGSGQPGTVSQGIVKGTILDQNGIQAVEYANIVLFKSKDSTMVTGGVTDGKGHFKIEKVPFGKYYALISFMGYSTKRIPEIMVNPKTQNVDLGTIKLDPISTKLNEVTITGERKEMEFTLDKKVVNVEKNLSTMGGTAVDVLSNIPSVTVDFEGQVSLRGNSNITVLIDGRPSGIMGSKLEQIPASSIETVEVITNPSARYNPEGMSGIINIKLRKKRELGFNGLVSANAGTGDKYNGSVNLNYNKGPLNIFGSYDLRSDRRNGSGYSTRTNNLNDSIWNVFNESESWRKGGSNNIKLGVDYAINAMNQLTLSWYTNKGSDTHGDASENSYTDANNIMSSYYTLNEEEESDNKSNDYILAYKRLFERKGQELTLDAVYSQNKGDDTGDNTLTYFSVPGLIPELEPELQNTRTKDNRTNANVQLNYIHPLDKDTRLEGGYQGVLRETDDDYHYGIFDYDLQTFAEDTNLSNHFVYKENIHAVYAIFGKVWEKYSMNLGLRYELADTKSEQRTSDKTYTNNYSSFYPTVHLNRKFPKDQEVQISYSRRVNRPDMWSLNPFVDYSNPSYIRYGNPYLKPEYVNAYELGYNKYFKKSTINASLFYRKINDVIKRVVFLDDNGAINMTSANLSYGESYGTELVVDHEFFKFWKMSLNLSYFKNVIKGDNTTTSMSNENYSWTSRVNTTVVLPKMFFVQINAFYRGPMVTPNGEMAEMFNADIAVRKDIIKDKLTANIRLSDVFNTMKFKNYSEGTGYTAETERKRETRILYAGLTWKIGGGIKQKARKKTDTGGGGGMEDEF